MPLGGARLFVVVAAWGPRFVGLGRHCGGRGPGRSSHSPGDAIALADFWFVTTPPGACTGFIAGALTGALAGRAAQNKVNHAGST